MGRNCFTPAELAAAKRLAHDDDAERELHVLLLLL
jgi:hypothetical protein